MRTYEFIFITETSFDEKKAEALVKKVLGKSVATVKEVTSWGKKKFAYPIRKLNEGLYTFARIESEGLKIGEIEQNIKLDGTIIRFLLTKKE